MAASMQHRPQERTFGMVMKEVDKDLALFLEMRNRENEKGDLFLNEKLNTDDDLTDIKYEEILTNRAAEGRDFDWLLTGADTPLCVPLAVEKPTSFEERNENPNSPALTSRSSRTTSSEDSASLKSKSMQPAKPANIRSSADGNRRPTSSGGRRSMPSRPATPTGRPSLPAMVKPSSTPNSRATGPSAKTVAPAVRSSTPTRIIARSSTPTARSSVPSSSKSVSRSATPTPSAISSVRSSANSKSRSATPTSTARSSAPSSTQTSSRSATPTSTARSSAPSSTQTSSRSATPSFKHNATPSSTSFQSSKAAKVEPTIMGVSVPSRGVSPTVKSRPSKPSEMPSLPRDAPNLSTLVNKRPNSASRVRPSATNSRSSSMEVRSSGKSRQQSCSPSRVRSSNMNARSTGPAMLSKSYGYGSCNDDVNPVLIGTQMVERVVNMRRLAPPKEADHLVDIISSKQSSTSQENSGFGRSLSKKSLDMAIRHMDLTRSIAGDTRKSKASTSASYFNVRNGSAKSKTAIVSNSQPSTRRDASCEPNLCANPQSLTRRPNDNGDTSNKNSSLPPDFQ